MQSLPMRACLATLLGVLLLGLAVSTDGCARSDKGAARDMGANDAWIVNDDASASNPMGCSGDLHHVLDGNGNIVQECPPDQGCSNAMCVPACAAAGASKGSVGCDFLVPTPSGGGACFAVFATNNWTTPAHLQLSRGMQAFDVTTVAHLPDGTIAPTSWPPLGVAGLPASQVAVIYLSSDAQFLLDCPSSPAISGASYVPFTAGEAAQFGATFPTESTGRGAAFHLTSDVPIGAYDIYPFGGATSVTPSATLLLPTTAWGTSYLAVLPPQGTYNGVDIDERWLQIVATADGTSVAIAPRHDLPSGPGVAAAPANMSTTYSLQAGEYLQWLMAGTTNNGDLELTGSIVASNKPVAFFGGNQALHLLSATSILSGSDEDHEQMPPVSSMGSTYIAAPFATRRASLAPESIWYRIVGIADGTQLIYDPPAPSAPTTLILGQYVDFESVTAFKVSSQDANHPFYLTQVMSGGNFTDGTRPGNSPGPGNDNLGDPEVSNILPPAQFLSKYVFMTDPTYGTTTLTLVRKSTAGAFQDVTIDCIGTVGGWTAIGSSSEYQFADVDLKRAAQQVGNCKDGAHVAESAAPFGLTVWGLDWGASYGYPAGGNAATINSAVLPPIL